MQFVNRAPADTAAPGQRTELRTVAPGPTEAPGPTTDVCVNVNGVDWVATETDGTAVLTTYGRDPAVQVTVPSDDRSGTDAVLAALSSIVTRVPQARECL